MHFSELQLDERLLRAVQKQGYTEPTPIQAQSIPHASTGRDIIGLAQTGTGKTAAFALPTLHRLLTTYDGKGRRVRALVLAPTRELANQIHESFKAYAAFTPIKAMVIYGGVSQRPQVQKLKRGVDVVVATPGRLLDLMGQGMVNTDSLNVLILDEADRMFDMGFLPDLRRIVQRLPMERQTMLFSATMPPDIQTLSGEILRDPVEVAVAPESTIVEAINQQLYFVEKGEKRSLLVHLLTERAMHRTLVFTRTKHRANTLTKKLNNANIRAAAIHGDKSQNKRERALENFRRGKIDVLVATDIVARGIDVDNISHVVNYDLPNETESYVHRIGRTGRAGADGVAVSFCAEDERKYLRDIERLIQMHIPVVASHPFESPNGLPRPTDLTGRRRSNNGNRNNGSGNRKRRRRSNGSNSNGSGNNNRSRNRRRRSRNNQQREAKPTT